MRTRDVSVFLTDLANICKAVEGVRDGDSFRDVARRIGRSPSYLSKVVGKVEREIGHDLFKEVEGRVAELVSKTDAEEFLARARKMLQAFDDLKSGWQIDRVKVGTFPSVITWLMSEALPNVLRKHGTQTEVVFKLGDNRDHLAALRAGSTDIVICNREEEELAEFDLRQVYPLKSEMGVLFSRGSANTEFIERLDGLGTVDAASLMNHLRTQPLFLLKDESERVGVPSIESPVVELLRSYFPPATTGLGSIVFVPTYRHLLLCLKRSDGAGIGPNELEGEDRAGALSFVSLSRIVDSGANEERARLLARIRKLATPSPVMYLRKGWEKGPAHGGLSKAAKTLIKETMAAGQRLKIHRYTS
jgi:DNA-binding transcriptional LysR family regulator